MASGSEPRRFSYEREAIAREPGFIAAYAVFAVLTAAVVALRFRVRNVQGIRAAADDWIMLACLVLTVVVCAVGIATAVKGLHGGSFHRQEPEEYSLYRMVFWSNVVVTQFVYGLCHCSYALFYRRFFSTDMAFKSRRKLRFLGSNSISIAFTIIFVLAVVYALASTLSLALVVMPPSTLWPSQPSEAEREAGYKLYAVIRVLVHFDFVWNGMAIVTVMFAYFHLRRNKKTSFFLQCFIFVNFGLAVATVIRAFYAWQLAAKGHKADSLSLVEPADFTDLWTRLECCLTIIFYSLPTLNAYSLGHSSGFDSFSGWSRAVFRGKLEEDDCEEKLIQTISAPDLSDELKR